MVAQRDTAPVKRARRKPKVDPVERARAEVARGVAEVDPALAAMIAEWHTLNAYIEDKTRPPLPDDASPVERLTEIQRAIYAFPAVSLADLYAKAPVLRDELDNFSGRPEGVEPFLEEQAWRGVIADLERLSASIKPSRVSTPQDAAGIDFEPFADVVAPTRQHWNALTDAHFDRIAFAFDLLDKTKPELMQMWVADEAAAGAAAAVERARDWLADTASLVDEALSRFLIAGAARAQTEAQAA